jgi:hypothetical protein
MVYTSHLIGGWSRTWMIRGISAGSFLSFTLAFGLMHAAWNSTGEHESYINVVSCRNTNQIHASNWPQLLVRKIKVKIINNSRHLVIRTFFASISSALERCFFVPNLEQGLSFFELQTHYLTLGVWQPFTRIWGACSVNILLSYWKTISIRAITFYLKFWLQKGSGV